MLHQVPCLRSLAPAAGNVEFTFWNVTVACSSLPAPPGAGPPDPPVAALASARGVGIAGSARDLLYYLGVDNVTQIILAGEKGARAPGHLPFTLRLSI